MNFDFDSFIEIVNDLFIDSPCFDLNGARDGGFDNSDANIKARASDHGLIQNGLISSFLKHILSDILLLFFFIFERDGVLISSLCFH